MTTQIEPVTAARIAVLAARLGFDGPDAGDRVLQLALDDLESKAPPPRGKMTPAEIAAEYQALSAAGRRWREENPDQYDENNPPSIAWQEELYDEHGLPK